MDVPFVCTANTVTVPPRRTEVFANNADRTAFMITIDISSGSTVGDGKIFIHRFIISFSLRPSALTV
jgi:hypothetical protein